MRRGQRIFLASMLLSLLAHLIAAGSASQWWTAPAPEIPFPIEARLHLAVVPTPASGAQPAAGKSAQRAAGRGKPWRPVGAATRGANCNARPRAGSHAGSLAASTGADSRDTA